MPCGWQQEETRLRLGHLPAWAQRPLERPAASQIGGASFVREYPTRKWIGCQQAGVSPVCSCRRGEPNPGAAVAGVVPTPVQKVHGRLDICHATKASRLTGGSDDPRHPRPTPATPRSAAAHAPSARARPQPRANGSAEPAASSLVRAPSSGSAPAHGRALQQSTQASSRTFQFVARLAAQRSANRLTGRAREGARLCCGTLQRAFARDACAAHMAVRSLGRVRAMWRRPPLCARVGAA